MQTAIVMADMKDTHVTSEACKPKSNMGSQSIVAAQKVVLVDLTSIKNREVHPIT